MASFRVALLVSGALLASVSAQAQVYYPQDQRLQNAQTTSGQTTSGQTLGQSYYAPVENREIAQQPQGYLPQQFRAAAEAQRASQFDPRGVDTRNQVLEHRAQIQDPRTLDPRIQDPRIQDTRTQDTRARVQDFRQNQDFRQTTDTRAQMPDYRSQMPDYRGAAQTNEPRRNLPVQAQQVLPQQVLTQPAYSQPMPRALAQEPRNQAPRAIEPNRQQLLVVDPPKPNYIDYKVLDGRPYDYRPMDYKPVDTRSMEYKSQENKGQDQKILDPRLKDKGPEIQARIDCKAIIYRAVECNFLDYREVDLKLQELMAKFPEISIGIVPKEYSKEAMDRWTPLITYLSKEVGLKISLKVANDYQALIESQKAGLVHVAVYSPMAFARARLSGAKVDAFAIETNADGSRGSHSVFYTMARGAGAGTRNDDLKGKSVGLVDPNSVSGYIMPRFAVAAQKLDPETFLGRQVFTGSHENALLALSQGLVDVAVGQWGSDEDSTIQKLFAKGQLKNVDGTAMRRDDFRVMLKSEMIMNSPIAYLSDLPEDVKAMIRRAMLEAPIRDKAAFERVYADKGRTWETVENKDFDVTVEMLRFMDETRKVQATIALKNASTGSLKPLR